MSVNSRPKRKCNTVASGGYAEGIDDDGEVSESSAYSDGSSTDTDDDAIESVECAGGAAGGKRKKMKQGKRAAGAPKPKRPKVPKELQLLYKATGKHAGMHWVKVTGVRNRVNIGMHHSLCPKLPTFRSEFWNREIKHNAVVRGDIEEFGMGGMRSKQIRMFFDHSDGTDNVVTMTVPIVFNMKDVDDVMRCLITGLTPYRPKFANFGGAFHTTSEYEFAEQLPQRNFTAVAAKGRRSMTRTCIVKMVTKKNNAGRIRFSRDYNTMRQIRKHFLGSLMSVWDAANFPERLERAYPGVDDLILAYLGIRDTGKVAVVSDAEQSTAIRQFRPGPACRLPETYMSSFGTMACLTGFIRLSDPIELRGWEFDDVFAFQKTLQSIHKHAAAVMFTFYAGSNTNCNYRLILDNNVNLYDNFTRWIVKCYNDNIVSGEIADDLFKCFVVFDVLH